MKKFYVVMIAFLLLGAYANASIDDKILIQRPVVSKVVLNSEDFENEFENRAYYNFLKNRIPSKFVYPFYSFTKDKKSLGLEILGIAQHESAWRVFKGKVNQNGSVDLGPLMLNSYNIENENFMRVYGIDCDKYKYDTDIYYMCICINFYSGIRKELGPYISLQVYNGGYRVTRKDCRADLKKTVTTYANVVYKYINEAIDDYNDFKEAYRQEFLSEFIEMRQFIESLERIKYNYIDDYTPVEEGIHKRARYIVYNKIDEETFEFFVLMKWKYTKIYYTSTITV